MEQLAKITKMEGHLDEAIAIIKEFSEVFDRYEQCLERIGELSEYYGSKDWFQDMKDYDTGKLPKSLKCGVLSEDLVYNMLTDNRELAIRMLEIGTKVIKKC